MSVRILQGDCREVLKTLPDESVHCVVTSPPYYGLRDYGAYAQIGLEKTPQQYIETMVNVFAEVRRILRPDGTLWLNLGDTYAANRGYQVADSKHKDVGNHMPARVPIGFKPKDLMMIPARVAIALHADGWWLRQDIIWNKRNAMPESITDRCTKAHEYIFLLTKSERYYFDHEAIMEPAVKAGRVVHSYNTGAKDRQDANEVNDRRTRIGLANWNTEVPDKRFARSVWDINVKGYPGAHFATFPTGVPERCIRAGCPVGGTVLDLFAGAGTTGLVADRLQRDAILIELNGDYVGILRRRLGDDAPLFTEVV